MSWKAGPEKPRTPFCWNCSRRFHGRVFARVLRYGEEHDVHKNCVTLDDVVIFRSGTVANPAKDAS